MWLVELSTLINMVQLVFKNINHSAPWMTKKAGIYFCLELAENYVVGRIKHAD